LRDHVLLSIAASLINRESPPIIVSLMDASPIFFILAFLENPILFDALFDYLISFQLKFFFLVFLLKYPKIEWVFSLHLMLPSLKV
jgi:hypothetical protein